MADLGDDPKVFLNVVLTVALPVSLDYFSLNEAFLRGEGLDLSK